MTRDPERERREEKGRDVEERSHDDGGGRGSTAGPVDDE